MGAHWRRSATSVFDTIEKTYAKTVWKVMGLRLQGYTQVFT